MGTILAVCVSARKGIRKKNVERATFLENFGIEGDAHSGHWHRQVSLLAWESIEKMRAKGLNVNVGSFAENITTCGIDLVSLPVGSRITLGSGVVLEVTQIGKECHTRCAIYYLAGDCVMPKEGIFARVARGGAAKAGDEIASVNVAPEPEAMAVPTAHATPKSPSGRSASSLDRVPTAHATPKSPSGRSASGLDRAP